MNDEFNNGKIPSSQQKATNTEKKRAVSLDNNDEQQRSCCSNRTTNKKRSTDEVYYPPSSSSEEEELTPKTKRVHPNPVRRGAYCLAPLDLTEEDEDEFHFSSFSSWGGPHSSNDSSSMSTSVPEDTILPPSFSLATSRNTIHDLSRLSSSIDLVSEDNNGSQLSSTAAADDDDDGPTMIRSSFHNSSSSAKDDNGVFSHEAFGRILRDIVYNNGHHRRADHQESADLVDDK